MKLYDLGFKEVREDPQWVVSSDGASNVRLMNSVTIAMMAY